MQPMKVRFLPPGPIYRFSIMNNTLGYEPGNRSLILLGGTKNKETIMAAIVVLVIFVVMYFFIRKL